MTAFTVNLPDEIHNRLTKVVKHRQMNMNKLFEEMTLVILAEFDAEARFNRRASQGSAKHGLELLEILRKRHREQGIVPGNDR